MLALENSRTYTPKGATRSGTLCMSSLAVCRASGQQAAASLRDLWQNESLLGPRIAATMDGDLQLKGCMKKLQLVLPQPVPGAPKPLTSFHSQEGVSTPFDESAEK